MVNARSLCANKDGSVLFILLLNNEPVERVGSEEDIQWKHRWTHILSEVIVALFFSSSSKKETNSCT